MPSDARPTSEAQPAKAALATRHFAPLDFRTNYPALGGLRAIAVILVFYVHYGGGFTGGRIVHLLDWIRERCWFSLDLFFVLSGFLITGILYDTQADSRFFQRFFTRRVIRILPVFYLVAVVLLLLTPVLHFQWRWLQLTFLFFIGNFFAANDLSLYLVPSAAHRNAEVFLSHFWSLFVEEQFYVLWPFLVWKVRERIALVRLSIALCAVSFLARTIVVLTIHAPAGERWTNHTLPFRLDSILMGAILALVLRGPGAFRWQRACRGIFLAASAITLVILLLPLSYGVPLTRSVGALTVAIACAGLVGCALRPESIAFRALNLRPLHYFGRYSYGFFLFHILFFAEWIQLRRLLGRVLHSPNAGGVLMLAITFASIFLLAKLSYDLFERRFLRLKKHFQYDAERAAHRHGYRT